MNELEKINNWLFYQCLANYEVIKITDKYALIDHSLNFTIPIAFFDNLDDIKKYLEGNL